MKTAALAQYAAIGAKALFKGLVVAIVGLLFSAITFMVGLLIGLDDIHVSAGGHGGGIGAALVAIIWLIQLFQVSPFTAILILGSLGAIYMYISIAMAMILYQSIHGFWKAGMGNKLVDKITKYVETILQKNSWMQETAQKGRLKIQLLEKLKEDRNAHPIERRVLRYGFKKLKLDLIDWSDKGNLTASIAAQVNEAIANIVKPSMKPFWILAVVQIICLICSIIFNK